MKLLLLTDCPPCRNLTGGLVLDQLCRFLPRGSIACFAVTNPDIEMRLTPDLDWMPIEYARKPRETGHYWPPGSALAPLTATAVESWRRLVEVPRLINRAVDFARQQQVDAIWTVLEGQTIVRMAVPVAERLGLPLYSLVWDPLSWWLSAHKVDRFNAGIALRQFDAAVRRSEACAVASWAMAEDYERRYGVRSIPVIASHDAALAASPPPRPRKTNELVLGMAGQFYASDEWHRLIGALNAARWRVAGREVRLKVLGHYVPVSDVPDGRLDFLGWKSQPEAIRILADETDVLYCPYPFDPGMEEVSRFSFPSKLPLYFAAGRPVLFHGPDYASPARYIAERDAGLCCTTSDGAAVVQALERLMRDPGLYAHLTRSSQRAFRTDFTLDVMRSNFFSFLGLGNTESGARAPNPGRTRARLRLPSRKAAVRRLALTVPKLREVYNYIQNLRRQRDRLALRIAAVSDEMQAMVVERDSLRKHVGLLDSAQAKLRADYTVLRKEREGLYDKLEALEAERAMLQAEAADAEALRAERDGLERKIGFLESSQDRLRAEHVALNAELDRLRGTVAALEANAAEAEQDAVPAPAVGRRIEALEAEIRRLRAEKRELEAHLRAREEHDKALTARRNGPDQLIARALGRLALMEYRIEALRPASAATVSSEAAGRYLDLLEAALVGSLSRDPAMPERPNGTAPDFDPEIRLIGRDWPAHAETMIGTVRMRNLRHLVERALADGVPGDLIETGVWRGGACIYMRGILAAHGVTDRKVWVADSFRGLPAPDPERFPADAGDLHHTHKVLAVSCEEVRRNFERYGLLDAQVAFLEGWFKDTLPTAPIERLAVLRLDGDMYESTIEALDALYGKVSPGGYVIIDDYILPGCREAVDDFRARHGIAAPLEEVDGAAVYWRVPADAAAIRPERPRGRSRVKAPRPAVGAQTG